MEHLLSSDNLLQAVLTLVGVFFSCFFYTGKATRNMKKELKKHEVYLQEKFYISSKRVDLEFEIFGKINLRCGELNKIMKRMLPIGISTYEINNNEGIPNLYDLSSKIEELEIEINVGMIFIPQSIVEQYEMLLEDAKKFICAMDKYNANRHEIELKENLRDKAYKILSNFEKNWVELNTKIKDYMYKIKEEIEY